MARVRVSKDLTRSELENIVVMILEEEVQDTACSLSTVSNGLVQQGVIAYTDQELLEVMTTLWRDKRGLVELGMTVNHKEFGFCLTALGRAHLKDCRVPNCAE